MSLEWEPGDPTPEEIEEACKKLRRKRRKLHQSRLKDKNNRLKRLPSGFEPLCECRVIKVDSLFRWKHDSQFTESQLCDCPYWATEGKD